MEQETLQIGKDKEEDESDSHQNDNNKTKKFYSQDDELASFLNRTSLASLGLGIQKGTPGKVVEKKRDEENVKDGYKTHTIQRTDTLSGIAVKYNTTVYELKKQNSLQSDLDMYSRKTLLVPLETQSVENPEDDRKDKIDMFLRNNVSEHCTEQVARDWLKKNSWNVERALTAHAEYCIEHSKEYDRAVERSVVSYSSCEEELGGPTAYFGVGSVVKDPTDKRAKEKMEGLVEEFDQNFEL